MMKGMAFLTTPSTTTTTINNKLPTLPTHQLIRLILLPLLLTSLLTPSLYQPLLNTLWTHLLTSPLYNLSTFETLWTVFCYTATEVFLVSVFMARPERRFTYKPDNPRSTSGRVRGMRRFSRRLGEIAVYVAPLLAMDLCMIKKFAGVEMAEILRSGGYDLDLFGDVNQAACIASNGSGNINGTTSTAKILSSSSSSSPPKTFLIPTLHNFTLSSPLQLHRALPPEAPTSRRLTTELILSFLIYDLLFFLFHLALHHIPLLRPWHIPHHTHPVQVNPQITNHLSVPERLGLVMLANFSLNVIGAHVLTRTVFVVVFVWLLVEIHCGMELEWGYEKVLPKGWGGGARKHARHHVDGSGGLAPFFGWCDAVWGWWVGKGLETKGSGVENQRERETKMKVKVKI